MIRVLCFCFFFFKQKTAYEMRISDWSSDVCSSDLSGHHRRAAAHHFSDRSLRQLVTLFVDYLRDMAGRGLADGVELVGELMRFEDEIGRASCRERVCQYV